jgi:hypothetical protein
VEAHVWRPPGLSSLSSHIRTEASGHPFQAVDEKLQAVRLHSNVKRPLATKIFLGLDERSSEPGRVLAALDVRLKRNSPTSTLNNQ